MGEEDDEERGKKKENNPREPSRELNAAATTTVGSMKGTAVIARSKDLPRKSYFENRMADGMPRIKVNIVERVAW